MKELKIQYNNTALKTFAKRAYSLWKGLPYNIQHTAPFVTLSYADDPLSYGDEKQSRELYESMFEHYNDGNSEVGNGI